MSRFEGFSNNKNTGNHAVLRSNRFARLEAQMPTNKEYEAVSEDGFWTKKASKTTENKHKLDLSHYLMNAEATPEQMTKYSVFYRIEEIIKKVSENDFSYIRIPQRERSPSPPPTYDDNGNRKNTREIRHKKKLEDEKIKLVQLSLKSLLNYASPDSYVKPNFFKEKFYLPVDEYQHINFIGLLLGPRGATLKSLQQENGCRIQIRGKGSFQKGRNEEEMPIGSMSEAEPLHCLVIADSEEKLRKGLKGCENVVVRAITAPSGQNDMKREQLKELAKLNGTYRDTESTACQICGNEGHNRFNCPKSEKYLATIQCSKCNKYGHLEEDCDVFTAKVNRFEDLRKSNNSGTAGKRKLTYDEIDEPEPKIAKVEVTKPVEVVEPEVKIIAPEPVIVEEEVIVENVLSSPPAEDSDIEEEVLAPPAEDSEIDEEVLAPPAIDDSDDDLAPPPAFDDDSD